MSGTERKLFQIENLYRLQRIRYPCVALRERWQEIQVGLGIFRAWEFEAVTNFCEGGTASGKGWFGDGEFASLRRLAEGRGAAMAVGGVWKVCSADCYKVTIIPFGLMADTVSNRPPSRAQSTLSTKYNNSIFVLLTRRLVNSVISQE